MHSPRSEDPFHRQSTAQSTPSFAFFHINKGNNSTDYRIIVGVSCEMSKEQTHLSNLDETETESEELDPPSEFICGLTMEIMHDPLMSKYGHNYEREAIIEWLTRGNDSCPMTRRPMRLSDLISNHNLRARIGEWRKEHRDEISNPSLVEITTPVPQCFGVISLDRQEVVRRRSSSSTHRSTRRHRHRQGSSQRRPSAAQSVATAAEVPSEQSRRGVSARFMRRLFSGRGVASRDVQQS